MNCASFIPFRLASGLNIWHSFLKTIFRIIKRFKNPRFLSFHSVLIPFIFATNWDISNFEYF